MAMAGVDINEPRGKIQNTLPVSRVEVAALRMVNERWRGTPLRLPRDQHVRAGKIARSLSLSRPSGHCHPPPPPMLLPAVRLRSRDDDHAAGVHPFAREAFQDPVERALPRF